LLPGGSVSDITRQESKRSGQKNVRPLSKEQDKIEKSYEDYKDFIDADDAYEKFMSIGNSK
jgi:hypothetical protein